MPAITIDKPRKDAPPVVIRPMYQDERVILVEKTKKKLGDKAKGMHFFFGDANIAKTGRYEDEGYMACGADHKGDPLFMRPSKMHSEHLAVAAGNSIEAKNAAKNAESGEYETRTAGGMSVRPKVEDE
jgi:hypothetical protein